MAEVEKEIEDLTSDELLDKNFIPSIFENYEDEEERNEILKEILVVAKKKRVLAKVKNNINEYTREMLLDKVDTQALVFMHITGKKVDDSTIDNYVQAILNTKDIASHILFNEFTGKFERIAENGKIRGWTDDDDAWVLNTIE